MAGSSGSGRLEDASYLQLRLSQAKAPLKKLSTQNTQFAHALFLFLLPGAFPAAFCSCCGAALSHCFCCCALKVLQPLCHFLKILY
jgi:hypothetical protein